MTYRVFRFASGEPVDSLEAHVLAKAYAAAWRALRFSDPVGRHVVGGLGLVIEFGAATARLDARVPGTRPPATNDL